MEIGKGVERRGRGCWAAVGAGREDVLRSKGRGYRDE